ncbi:MAG: hydroxylamine reductase, partial [Sporomusa sp.]
MSKMFCFQCEQTAAGTGCQGGAGVCGKKSDTANLQDELTGALIALARIAGDNKLPADIDRTVIEGLFTTVTNVSFDNSAIQKQIAKTEQAKTDLMANLSSDNYNMAELWQANEDIRSLKSLILFGIRGIAAYAYHAMVLGYTDDEVNRFFYKALRVIGEDLSADELLPVVMETGQINLKCMALLDKANTETYGTPTPTQVSMTIEKGPFIVVSGHDLYDLYLLLEQTKDKGI